MNFRSHFISTRKKYFYYLPCSERKIGVNFFLSFQPVFLHGSTACPFFFFLNHICLFCVATFSNAILCNIKSCFQWIEGLVTSHIRGQNQLTWLNDLLSQYSWRQKGTFINTLFQSISEQNYKYNAIDLFIFLI